MISKVLVQWAVAADLRHKRMLQLGNQGAGHIAQVAIERSHPLFPTFYTIAAAQNSWFGGFPLLKVGFAGATRHNGVYWDGSGLTVLHAYQAEPTPEELLYQAVEQYGRPSEELVEATAATVRGFIQAQKEQNDRATAAHWERVKLAEGAGIQTVVMDGGEEPPEVPAPPPAPAPSRRNLYLRRAAEYTVAACSIAALLYLALTA